MFLRVFIPLLLLSGVRASPAVVRTGGERATSHVRVQARIDRYSNCEEDDGVLQYVLGGGEEEPDMFPDGWVDPRLGGGSMIDVRRLCTQPYSLSGVFDDITLFGLI